MIITKQTMTTSIEFDTEPSGIIETIQKVLHTALGIKEDGYEYSPAFKRGHWDGITAFYNEKAQTLPTGLLPQAIKAIKTLQNTYPNISYTLVDELPEEFISQDKIPTEISLTDDKLGQITLRDYQYDAVRSSLESHVGLVFAATNARQN